MQREEWITPELSLVQGGVVAPQGPADGSQAEQVFLVRDTSMEEIELPAGTVMATAGPMGEEHEELLDVMQDPEEFLRWRSRGAAGNDRLRAHLHARGEPARQHQVVFPSHRARPS